MAKLCFFWSRLRKDDMRLLCRDICAEPGHLDVYRRIAFEEYVRTASPFSLLANLEEEDEWEWYQALHREPAEDDEPLEPLESMDPLEPLDLLSDGVANAEAPQELKEHRLSLEAAEIRGAQLGFIKDRPATRGDFK